MPLKNAKHELFAQELASGENASQAYRNAGYSENRSAACRLSQDVRIQQRLAELLTQRARRHDKATEKAVSELGLSKQWVLARLVENAEQALARKDGNVANRSLELIGKEQGMFIDRKESGAPGDFAGLQSADEVLALVRAELGAETAALLAKALGKQEASEPIEDDPNSALVTSTLN
jgi:hypothetical protein